jgi:hypothetical protein
MHNQMNKQQLNEGLRPKDLAEMVHTTFEVDTYRSKMGEDQDVCVLTFEVRDRQPARDLMEFLEKGYTFVLDSDVSSGENKDGEYFVFVELSRTPQLAEQIKDIMYGVKKLTGIDDWKFKYYKSSEEYSVTEETLSNVIPNSPKIYETSMMKFQTEDIKKFFNKTLMDDLTFDGKLITIHKPFGNKITLEMVKDGDPKAVLEGITDPIAADETATSEIFWLTKVLGDYNINKMGDHFVFENGQRAMLLKRKD